MTEPLTEEERQAIRAFADDFPDWKPQLGRLLGLLEQAERENESKRESLRDIGRFARERAEALERSQVENGALRGRLEQSEARVRAYELEAEDPFRCTD